MRFASTITIRCGVREAARLRACLSPEMSGHKSERATVTMSQDKDRIIITIESENIPAIRAAFNSITKLVSVYEDVKTIK